MAKEKKKRKKSRTTEPSTPEKPTLADLQLYEVTLSESRPTDDYDYHDDKHEFVAAVSMTDAAALFDGIKRTKRIIHIEELCMSEYFHLTDAVSLIIHNAVQARTWKDVPKIKIPLDQEESEEK